MVNEAPAGSVTTRLTHVAVGRRLVTVAVSVPTYPRSVGSRTSRCAVTSTRPAVAALGAAAAGAARVISAAVPPSSAVAIRAVRVVMLFLP